jgi:hypothetical protein
VRYPEASTPEPIVLPVTVTSRVYIDVVMGLPSHHWFPPRRNPKPRCTPRRRGFSYTNIYRERSLLNDGLHRFRPRSLAPWSRRELERFEQTADEADPRTLHMRRKLQEDVDKAERDLRYAQGQCERVFP